MDNKNLYELKGGLEIMRWKKITAGMLSLAMVFSSVSGIGRMEKTAEAAVASKLPALSGLYVAEYMEWDNDRVRTDTDASGNTVLVNGDGEQISYRDQDNPEYLTKGISEEWGQGFDNNDEQWFDYIADGKVTHVNPSELTITHLDGTPCDEITVTAKESDPRVAVFHVNSLERVKITYKGAEVNNTLIGEFELRSGFYTSETMSLDSQITGDVNIVSGKSKELYFHMTEAWEEAGFRFEPESAVTVRYWDDENQKDVELSGAEAKEYVTLTPVSENDPHHLIYKAAVQGKSTTENGFELILRYTAYNQNDASDTREDDRRVNIRIVEGNMLYAANADDLTVKGDRYVYAANAYFSSDGWYGAGSTVSPVYMLFQHTDEDGALSTVSDLSKLTFYRSEYNEEQEKDVFTRADAGELKVEKAYADSNLVKVSYTGGPIEFSNEYVVTYDGAEPRPYDEHRSISIAFGPAILANGIGTYSSTEVSDSTYAKEFHTDGVTDLDIYAAALDVSDRIFWNTVHSVSLKSFTLTDENGNDLSAKVKTEKNITFKEETGHTTIYGEKFTIPKGTLKSSARLRMEFTVQATGGDGRESNYETSLNTYIFYSEPVNTPATKAKNPMTLKVSKKTYSQKKDLTKKKTFNIGVKKAQGTVTYTLDAKAKKAKITVSKKGKVTVPKKCKKGSYTITVKAKGNAKYLSGKKTVTIKVK